MFGTKSVLSTLTPGTIYSTLYYLVPVAERVFVADFIVLAEFCFVENNFHIHPGGIVQ